MKYKNDEVFIKEIPNVDVLINMLQQDEDLYREYIRNTEEYHIVFINAFQDRREDIEWFYDNKDKYFKDIVSYDFIDSNMEWDEDDQCCHNCIWLLKTCQNGNYMNAYEYLYIQDYMFLFTYEEFTHRGELVKDAIMLLIEIINKTYEHYKKTRTKNRDITKENNNMINKLREYSNDEIFMKEISDAYKIIDTLEIANLTDSEDEKYRAYELLSNVKNSISLYEGRRNDIKYFYEHRRLSNLIYKEKIQYYKDSSIYNYKKAYIDILSWYITNYENSKTFAELWYLITDTIMNNETVNPSINIAYNKEPIKEFMEWVISEINNTYRI